MASKAKDGGKPSRGGALVPVLVLTLAAGGGGALIGRQIVASTRAGDTRVTDTPETAKPAPERSLRELTPVITNLAAPVGSWIRLQTAVVYDRADGPTMDTLAPQIAEDVLAFVRTLTLDQLQGASGLDALRDDLNERAKLRSNGRVRELLIETLVVR